MTSNQVPIFPPRRERREAARKAGEKFIPLQQLPMYRECPGGPTAKVRSNGFYTQVAHQIAEYAARLKREGRLA